MNQIFLALVFILPTLIAPLAYGRQVAILGDSLSTGAVTRAGMAFDENILVKHFRGAPYLRPTPDDRVAMEVAGYEAAADFQPPRRLAPSWGEMREGLSWVVRNALFRFGHTYLDQEVFSWGNLVARRAGVTPSNVLVAAEDGARAEHAYGQANRLLEASTDLPEDVFFLFTGNDLCGPTADKVTSAEDYALSLERGVRYLMRNGKAGPQGTTFWLVEPMPIMQLVHSPEILNKKVSAHGQTVTCRDLQSGALSAPPPTMSTLEDADWAFLMRFFPKGPGDMCPAVFQGTAGSLNLANRLHSYRRAMNEIPERLGNQAGFRVRVVSDTAALLFESQDIAEDCFHLSLHGQIKLAETVRKGMKDTTLQSRR